MYWLYDLFYKFQLLKLCWKNKIAFWEVYDHSINELLLM